MYYWLYIDVVLRPNKSLYWILSYTAWCHLPKLLNIYTYTWSEIKLANFILRPRMPKYVCYEFVYPLTISLWHFSLFIPYTSNYQYSCTSPHVLFYLTKILLAFLLRPALFPMQNIYIYTLRYSVAISLSGPHLYSSCVLVHRCVSNPDNRASHDTMTGEWLTGE